MKLLRVEKYNCFFSGNSLESEKKLDLVRFQAKITFTFEFNSLHKRIEMENEEKIREKMEQNRGKREEWEKNGKLFVNG